jgi:penicillin-binding protein 1A
VLEHAVAYATFPNLGKAVMPHAVLEVRTGTGELVWRFDRNGKRPQQVISPRVALEMIGMMNSVVENGTGRRAQLDGLKVAGKTGTTNGFRDAWFVGYTGNFVGAVWMGNDDYSPTKRMTGGTIPALIWHNVMAYAHQGIVLRPLPGLPPPQHAPAVADAAFAQKPAARQILLTRKGTEALLHVERVLDEASHATRVPISQIAQATGSEAPPLILGTNIDAQSGNLMTTVTQAPSVAAAAANVKDQSLNTISKTLLHETTRLKDDATGWAHKWQELELDLKLGFDLKKNQDAAVTGRERRPSPSQDRASPPACN